MELTRLRISNFQSFGPNPTEISLDATTFLIGANGTGKTAILQALARLFAFDPSLRRIRTSDFHRSGNPVGDNGVDSSLWIEADFVFSELNEPDGKYPTIPAHFSHMRLEAPDDLPRLRYRLSAAIDDEGVIEERLEFVLQTDDNQVPTKAAPVQKHDRNHIQMHYLPARRHPSDHISYSATSLLGRILRAANWEKEQGTIAELTHSISQALAGNGAIKGIDQDLASHWGALHRGTYFAQPHVSFERNELDNLLRHLTVGFSPGPTERIVDYTRLSDGQQSLLYISLVLATQAIGRKVLLGDLAGFDGAKLRPAVFTILAVEEPENSIAPHCLGRIIASVTAFSDQYDAQTIIATHAPSLLRRVPPEHIRYVRLNANRETEVTPIKLPNEINSAHKFVRGAVQAFPELYFSRLVILGEGDSEAIVLPRLLRAAGVAEDEASICTVPLGGRHVNHMWRLLAALRIPHLTLLDLDLARNRGGWGRLRYATQQLVEYSPSALNFTSDDLASLPEWNDSADLMDDDRGWLARLESMGVFFSAPLDLDFAMLLAFPAAYAVSPVEIGEPDDTSTASVLGKSRGSLAQFTAGERQHFSAYHRRFKLGSKPAAHLEALAQLTDAEIAASMPAELARLIESVKSTLKELHD